MELEFDKEMDALLRKAAGRGVLIGNDAKSHLDADTIAAFAENALPVKSRTIYTQHLAECDPCRMSLANLISLNAAAEPAMAAATAPVPALSVPWYRKLFQAPNLAYVMGGLVLIFGGLFGLIVLQNSYNSESVAVSQLPESPATESAPARAEGANSLYSANTVSNAATNAPGEIPRSVGVADDQLVAESNTGAVPPPPPSVASGDAAPPSTVKDLSIDGLDKAKPTQLQPAPMNAPKREEDAQEKKEVKLAAAEQEIRKQDQNAGNIYNQQQQNQMMPNSGAKTIGPSRNAIQRDNRAYDDGKSRVRSDEAGSGRGEASGTRRAGGKTFELKQGAWYDTAYSGQKTKNVRRSSDDYRKLDPGLRSIADSIGGTVVIVWNGKAYRIQ
jgi:hypothetical protein